MMKLRVFAFLIILFTGHTVFAEALSRDENSTPRSSKIVFKESQSFAGFSIFLYLPLMDDSALSSIMAQSQLTVTPTATYTVRAIRITSWNSANGSCTNQFGVATIDNGVGNTVSLTNGHNYTSTDASNQAFVTATGGIGSSTFDPNFDTTFQLLDNSLSNIGSSACIQGSTGTDPGTCTGVTNCGWNSARTWTP